MFIHISRFLAQNKTSAQGCMAIRSAGGICAMKEHPDKRCIKRLLAI
jgi:hypothetical protein